MPPSPEIVAGCHLEIRAGHGGAQTLTIESEGGDKAHLMEVSENSTKSSSFTPRQVVALVKRAVKKDAEKLLPPCRGAEWLKDLRALCRKEKQKVLGR